jgi:hypothetical protein
MRELCVPAPERRERVDLNPHEARSAAALFEGMFPADESGATEMGFVDFFGMLREHL